MRILSSEPYRARGLHQPRLRSRDPSGFTLIELLVVIAIICLLMSLAAPSLSKMRARAEEMACSNNLRQLAMAALAYEADNKGYLPTPYYRNNEQREKNWWLNSLAPYLGVPRYDDAEAENAPFGPSVLTCPSQYRLNPQRYTYAQNHQLDYSSSDGQPWSSANQAVPVKRYHLMRNYKIDPNIWPAGASGIPYFMDGWVWVQKDSKYTSWRHAASIYGDMPRIFPHNGWCNMVFLDGHVKKTRLEGGPWHPRRPRFMDDELAF